MEATGLDKTHTNSYGAKENAWLIATLSKGTLLGKYIKTDAVAVEPSYDKDFNATINTKYVVPEYTAPTDEEMKSVSWPSFTDADGKVWYGTVFGNVGGASKISTANFVATATNGESLELAVKNNAGKIEASSEGLIFYYTRLPAGTNFTLSATATINDIAANNQVSFGLMARDDLYINKYITSTMGDYVAAGTRNQGAINCFGRKSETLTDGPKATKTYGAGDTLNLNITGNSDGFAMTYGENATVTTGFDIALTSVDPDYIYVGFYVIRNADITFSNIKLEVEDESDIVTPGTGDGDSQTPGTGDGDSQTPGTGDGDSQTPGTGDGDSQTPGTGNGDDQTPGTGDGDSQTPGTGDGDSQTPGTGNGDDQTPGTGDGDSQTPGTGDGDSQTPGTGNGDSQTPGTGDGDNQNPGTEGGNEGGSDNNETNEYSEEFDFRLAVGSYTYTGKPIIPEIVVSGNGKELTEGVDYTVNYRNNTNVGTTASVTVKGIGDYTGTKSLNFEITPKDIRDTEDEDIKVSSLQVVKGTKASAISPVIVYNGVTLKKNTDFEIKDSTVLNTVGTVKVKVTSTGKKNFTGEREIEVEVVENKNAITVKNIAIEFANPTDKSLTYNGEAQKPPVKVYVKGDISKTALSEGEDKDYILIYNDKPTDVGSYTVTAVGVGNYTGSVKLTYKITPAKLTNSEIKANFVGGILKYSYTGTGVTPDVVVKYKDKSLQLGTEYKITYSNNNKVGANAQCKITFIGNYKGSKIDPLTFTITPCELSTASNLEVIATDVIATKSTVTSYKSKNVFVKLNGVTLKSSEYTLSYYKDPERKDEISNSNKLTLDSDKAPVYLMVTAKKNANFTGEIKQGSYNVWLKSADTVIDLSKSSKITFVDDNNKKISSMAYTGKDVEPSVKLEVTVKVTEGKKKVNKKITISKEEIKNYFNVEYANNKNKGTATVIITPKESTYEMGGVKYQFAGSKTATYKITAKKITATKK
jgi:hypothetical protein